MGFVSSLISGIGGQQAASQAASTESSYYNQALANEQPYMTSGSYATGELANELQSGQLGQSFNPTMQDLASTPGYQFTLQQGLESTQNAAASRGLGVSGAALKGASSYASGLASQTYQQQFQDYWANQNNRYSMLSGLANTGANVSTASGQQAVTTGQNVGTAQAAGTSSLYNGIAGAVGSLTGSNLLTSSGGTAGLSNATTQSNALTGQGIY